MCFVFIWEQTTTFAPYNINWLVFTTKMKSVYCAVRTGSLTKTVCASYLKAWDDDVFVYGEKAGTCTEMVAAPKTPHRFSWFGYCTILQYYSSKGTFAFTPTIKVIFRNKEKQAWKYTQHRPLGKTAFLVLPEIFPACLPFTWNL